MGGDRKETDEKEKIFEMVDRGGISGFHCRETSPRKTEHPPRHRILHGTARHTVTMNI